MCQHPTRVPRISRYRPQEYSLITHSKFSAPLYFNEPNDTLVLPENIWSCIYARNSSPDSIVRVTSVAVIGPVIERFLVRDSIHITYDQSLQTRIYASLLPFRNLDEVLIVEPKMELKGRVMVFDLTGESDAGITPKLKVVVNDWMENLKENLEFFFRLELVVEGPEARSRGRSAWWADPKFTHVTEKEFKVRFPLDG
jgi:hypothetical protein